MSQFKIHFSKDNIRRFKSSNSPTWTEFVDLLESMYPGDYHLEKVIKYIDEDGDFISVGSQLEFDEMMSFFEGEKLIRIYVEEGDMPYFKDGPQPEPVKFYVDQFTKEAVDVANEFMTDLERNVPLVIQGLFSNGKIIPAHLPEFLKGAVKLDYLNGNVVDVDVDIAALFDALHDKALELLESVNTSDLEKARDYLLATITIIPDHMTALYNLACADSLLGDVQSSVDHLEKAINAGFRDFTHLLKDADLDNLRNSEAFERIANKIRELVDTTEYAEPEASELEISTQDIPVEEPELEEPKDIQTQPEYDLSESVMPLQHKHQASLQQLKEMGFNADTDVMLLLLEEYNGNIQDVAQFLLKFQ
eukprot:TRINITY_DN1884_c1_g1_i1.p1 TRINITY_DN1884_c1_g1~~TRINITY_DN1884_c1_g1_i1.p1  ORF type:complete len:382 (-),score=114.71 TRINITY_DN1884_c1_g1_i1:47-1135(-)